MEMSKFPDKKLRKKGFKDTKQKGFEHFRNSETSKFIKEKYDEDKVNLIKYYNSLGLEMPECFLILFGEITKVLILM